MGLALRVNRQGMIRSGVVLIFLVCWSSLSNTAGLPRQESAKLQLAINPLNTFDPWQEFTYDIHVEKAGAEICTGWIYPIYNLPANEWPLRRSCHTADTTHLFERWGGSHYPLPYNGDYLGFVEYRDVTIQQRFSVLASSNSY